jgi:hypothetical protein
MFNILAKIFEQSLIGSGPSALKVHPGQLSRWLDEVWSAGPNQIGVAPAGAALPFLGNPGGIVAALDSPKAPAIFKDPSGINPADPAQFTNLPGPVTTAAGVPPLWHHLIYAYLLENTGMVEIFAEVLRRAAQGETLDIESNEAVQWLRSTEDLFFRESPLFSVGTVTSQLRPESRVVRRNAYWRMFGMDLSHPVSAQGSSGARDWKQHTGNGVNTTFREKWSELLRQIWLGIENRNNAVGTNATDDAYLLLLCESLRDMLTMRRRAGFLAREEFASVAIMSWFELTLSADTPIVAALNANATSPADRLNLIAQRVGMKPAPRSRELFELAELMSLILRMLEANAFSVPTNVALFYNPATPVFTTMNRIIDLWQSATSERVKERPVGNVIVPASAQPLRIPDTQPLTVPRLVARTTNGGRS